MFKVEIIGNIGQDAKVVDYNGNKFVSFSVAHSVRLYLERRWRRIAAISESRKASVRSRKWQVAHIPGQQQPCDPCNM